MNLRQYEIYENRQIYFNIKLWKDFFRLPMYFLGLTARIGPSLLFKQKDLLFLNN